VNRLETRSIIAKSPARDRSGCESPNKCPASSGKVFSLSRGIGPACRIGVLITRDNIVAIFSLFDNLLAGWLRPFDERLAKVQGARLRERA
jgi:hypothetical protein